MSSGNTGDHNIPVLAPDLVPPILNMAIIDEVIDVTDEDALQMTDRLAWEEGLLVGISSGSNVLASLQAAKRLGSGKVVVTIFPDRGEKYLSFSLHAWLSLAPRFTGRPSSTGRTIMPMQ